MLSDYSKETEKTRRVGSRGSQSWAEKESLSDGKELIVMYVMWRTEGLMIWEDHTSGGKGILSYSAAPSYPTLCDPMDCSTPGFPVLHHLPEFTETHVHRVSDAIQPSHPLSSPSPPAFSLSQHQGLFQWVSSSHQVAKVGASASASVLPMNIQGWFPLGLTGLIPILPKGLSRIFSSTTGIQTDHTSEETGMAVLRG